MKACILVDDRLEAFLEELLTAPERREVENHLVECADCRAAFKRAKEIEGALKMQISAQVPSDAIVAASVNEGRPVVETDPSPWRRRTRLQAFGLTLFAPNRKPAPRLARP